MGEKAKVWRAAPAAVTGSGQRLGKLRSTSPLFFAFVAVFFFTVCYIGSNSMLLFLPLPYQQQQIAKLGRQKQSFQKLEELTPTDDVATTDAFLKARRAVVEKEERPEGALAGGLPSISGMIRERCAGTQGGWCEQSLMQSPMPSKVSCMCFQSLLSAILCDPRMPSTDVKVKTKEAYMHVA
jgi:hypothetical protein